jgi:metal-responsive CopG/Arc/MetJ family transcriptional regulator
MAKKKTGRTHLTVSVSLSPELNKRLNEYGRSHALGRSSVISTALKTYLDSEELKPNLALLSKAFTKIADNGKIDKETTKQIEAFDTLVKMMEGSK